MKTRLNVAALVVLVSVLAASLVAADVRDEINFPDIIDCKTLKCDFHMHTVFSDGQVWPTVRVDEAWRQGLDAIAITDHIEYQPHKDDIPTNHNRPYEIAAGRAKEKNILLIKGAEFTRETPPGHFNAIFLDDIKPLDTEELSDAIKAAADQGGFVSWNHPFWKPEAKGWEDFHTELYENKWLKGLEVANGDSYYPEVFKWALERNLTILGNSDIHGPDLKSEYSPQDHRTITLVFAKERTVEAVKEALLEGRTAIWYKNQLIGRQKYLGAIFNASVRATRAHERRNDTVWFEIANNCDIDIELRRAGSRGPRELTLPANVTTLVRTGAKKDAETLELSYTVRNFLTGPDKGLAVNLTIPLK